ISATVFSPRIASNAIRALNDAEWFRLGFFMDFFPPVTLSPGQKSTYTRVLNTGATSFIKQVRTKVTEGTSGLFLLLGAVTVDRVVEAFKAAPHFELIASNLTHEQEQKLKDAFG